MTGQNRALCGDPENREVLVVKNPPANAGDTWDSCLVPGSGRPPGEGHGNPQYSWLENPMDGGDWRATIHGVAKSQTRLSTITVNRFFNTISHMLGLFYML